MMNPSRIEKSTPSLFASLHISMLSDGRWFVLNPRRRFAATEADAEAIGRLDIINANALDGRCDDKGRLYDGQLPLTREELRDGIKREWTYEARQAVHRYRKPSQPQETPEQRYNRELRAKIAEQEFRALPIDKQRLIESNKRLAAERAEAERAQVRQRNDYLQISEQIDNLEFLAKFDSAFSPVVLDAIRHIRDTLHQTTDVPAAFTNLAEVTSFMLGKRKSEEIQFRQSVDSAALAAEWSLEEKKESVWDRPHTTRMEGGVELVTLHHKGQTLHVSTTLMAGKTDQQLVAEFFPATGPVSE